MPYKVEAPVGAAGTGPYWGCLKINDVSDIEGWSEGYWINKPNPTAALEYLMDKVWDTRRGLLSEDCELVEANVSSTNVKGDSTPEFPKGALVEGKWNVATGDFTKAMPNNICLWLRLYTSNPLVRAVRPLHALPGLIFDQKANEVRKTKVMAAWTAQLAKYEAMLEEGVVELVKRTAVGGGPNNSDTIVHFPITSVVVPTKTRYRKVGRPFGLLQGRRA